ncbi:MAG TPA: hypothetical protein DCG14_04265, partial [Phycisphaerales bacterium]|nr:hypothetical protein [Phycisphaerales bacterium]
MVANRSRRGGNEGPPGPRIALLLETPRPPPRTLLQAGSGYALVMSDTHDFDLLVIGSGPAGQSAAIQASKLHKRVAMIEKRRRVGGVCTFTGTIPSKTLREAIISSVGGNADDEYGIRRRPEMADLIARVDAVIASETRVVRNSLARNDITVLEGEASFVDSHRVAITNDAGTRAVTAENIMVACGTNAAAPPTGPSDGRLIMTSDDVLKMKNLPSNLAVVGGG